MAHCLHDLSDPTLENLGLFHLLYFRLVIEMHLWLKDEIATDLGSDSLEQLSEADIGSLDLVADADSVIMEHQLWC